eukprot:scaffold72569_cov23-Prasinocladus_malaysianus.AAC.2
MERRTGWQAGITGPHCSFPSFACASDVQELGKRPNTLAWECVAAWNRLGSGINLATFSLYSTFASLSLSLHSSLLNARRQRAAQHQPGVPISRQAGSDARFVILRSSCSSCFALRLVIVKNLSPDRPMGRDVEHGNDTRRRYHYYPARQAVISPHPSTVKLP